jgi:dienelactone hydrolase
MNRSLLLLLALGCAAAASAGETARLPGCEHQPQVCLASLEELTVPELRKRRYTSEYRLLAPYPTGGEGTALMLGYRSDGLDLYSRLDLPSSPAPEAGYPLIVMAAGWVGREQAIDWDFGGVGDAEYGGLIRAWTDSGFAVLVPGYRGRGTVAGVPADGMEFRDAWGNGSYLSPIFYAIDVLNLIAGLERLASLEWQLWLPEDQPAPVFDLDRVSLWGHSQGGDVAVTALAVAGANPDYPGQLLAASIWAGNIPDRFTQADTFGAMATSLQAFMSGDGHWTGSAEGRNGRINPDFVFGWPSDWIGTIDPNSPNWTWQADTWSTATVAEARASKYREMYDTLNRYAADFGAAGFRMGRDDSGRSIVHHDRRVARLMPQVGGFHFANYIRTPLALHISDRDYYSMPAWNHDLARRINAAGGQARVYVYPGTTHSLDVSQHRWFSPMGTESAVPAALARDLTLFASGRLAN